MNQSEEGISTHIASLPDVHKVDQGQEAAYLIYAAPIVALAVPMAVTAAPVLLPVYGSAAVLDNKGETKYQQATITTLKTIRDVPLGTNSDALRANHAPLKLKPARGNQDGCGADKILLSGTKMNHSVYYLAQGDTVFKVFTNDHQSIGAQRSSRYFASLRLNLLLADLGGFAGG